MAVPPSHIRELLEAEIRNNPRRLVRVMDYLVVAAHDHGGRMPAGYAGPVNVAEGVRIERLDNDLAERLLDATALRGENWGPVRTFHPVHAYVRDVWAEEIERHRTSSTSGTTRAESGLLYSSRGSYATTTRQPSTRCVASCTPIRASSSSRSTGMGVTWCTGCNPDREGWLDVDEAGELRALLDAFWSEPELPARVRRALRQADAITSERYLEDALPLVVGAFESLVKIGRSLVTAQFSQRVPALAAEVEVELSVAECEEVYDDRSALVHGAGVDLSKPHDLDEFGRRFNSLQETLRRVVRLAIEDREFAAIFENDASIIDRWPAVVRSVSSR